MKFIVEKEVFTKLPNVCFGVVVAKIKGGPNGVDKIESLLDSGIDSAFSYFEGKNVKEEKDIVPYREAFAALEINPNKYMCSIEALFTRIAKGKGMPHINPIVDLGNAISLKHVLPIGAHDITNNTDDVMVRFSQDSDTFIPFGSTEYDNPESSELVYATGSDIRTRRWTWRQGELGKITEESSLIFFPIDGFTDYNKDRVLKARDELNQLLNDVFTCETEVGFVDAENSEMAITLL